MNPKSLVRIRFISQVVFFIALVLLVGGAFCAFSLGDKQVFTCPVGTLQITLASRALIWSVILSGLVMVVITILFGRVFCSWICPFGSILDWLNKGLQKRRISKCEGSKKESALINRKSKYGILVGALLSAGILKSPVFCILCPLGNTCRSIGKQGTRFGLETLFIPLIAGLEVFHKRFWCKYLCPIGGFLALVDRFSLKRVKLPVANCLGCGRCEKSCSMDIEPGSNIHKNFKKDPQVLELLMEQGQPDILDQPIPFSSLNNDIQKKLKSLEKNYPVPPGECTRCYECRAACPLLVSKKDSLS